MWLVTFWCQGKCFKRNMMIRIMNTIQENCICIDGLDIIKFTCRGYVFSLAPFFAGPSRVVFTKLFFVTLPVTSEAVHWHSEATNMASMVHLTAISAVAYIIRTLKVSGVCNKSLWVKTTRVLLLRWRPCVITWLHRSSVVAHGSTGNRTSRAPEGLRDATRFGSLGCLRGCRTGMMGRPLLKLGFTTWPLCATYAATRCLGQFQIIDETFCSQFR